MRKALLFLLLIAAILFFLFLRFNDLEPVLAKINDVSSVGGLKYKVFALGILPIGEAEFAIPKEEEYKGRQVLHLSATARSASYFSMLFSGYAILDSFMDKESLSAFEFKQKLVLPGKPDDYKEVFYDQGGGVMTMNGEDRLIPPKTQDPLSLAANIRKMDFGKIKEFEFNINSHQNNYSFIGAVTPEEISLHSKTYRLYILKADIQSKENSRRPKFKVEIVLLKGMDGNIPIKMRVFYGVFLITARLEGFE